MSNPDSEEPYPFEGLTDYNDSDYQYAVVVVGTAKSQRFANVVGPFPSKREATNWAARSRRRGGTERVLYRLTWHIRPMIPLDKADG